MKIPGDFINKFDNKYFIVFCLLLAIINKSLISIAYTDLEADKSLYLLFAATFLKTNTWLEPLSLIDDHVTYYLFNPAIYSPLYSFLAAPLIFITKSFYQTSYIIDIISWTVFFTGLYQFSNSIFSNRVIVGVFVLFIGFFTYPHLFASTPKDTLSIGLIFWCVFQLSTLLKSIDLTIRDILITSLLFFLLAISKFLYVPLVLALIAILMAGAMVKKNKKYLLYSGCIAFFSLCLIWGLKLFFQSQDSTSPQVPFPARQDIFIRQWQPENLLHFYPFISSSLMNLDFWGVQLEKLMSFSYAAFIKLIRFFDVALLVLLIVFYKRIIRLFNKTNYAIVLISTTLSVAILFMLAYMSATYKSITSTHTIWTYVVEARSYLFIVVFLQVLFFQIIFKPGFNNIIKYVLIGLFSLELLHGIYFSIKQIPRSAAIQKEIASNSAIKKVTNAALALQKENPSYNIKLITSNEHLRRFATLHGINAYVYSLDFPFKNIADDKKTIYLLTEQANFITNDSSRIQHLDISPFLVKLVKNQ